MALNNLPVTTAILRRSHNAKIHALNKEFSVYTEYISDCFPDDGKLHVLCLLLLDGMPFIESID